jgi:hypothetical protein
MNARLTLAAAVMAAFVPLAGDASARQLTGEEIRELVSGRTVFLSAPFGGELPLNYRVNGTVDGNGQAIGLGRFFAPRDTGRWFIAGNRLCQQFQSWYNGERLCFTVADLGNNRIRWVRDNGEQGVARVSP